MIVQSHSCCFMTVSHTVCTFLFLSFHRTPSYHLSIFCCITVKWLSLWSEVQTCIWPSWCHCHSLSLASVKSRLVLLFWYWLTKIVLDKGPLNGCVCLCVCVKGLSIPSFAVSNLCRWDSVRYFNTIHKNQIVLVLVSWNAVLFSFSTSHIPLP